MKRIGFVLLFFSFLVLLSCGEKKDTSMSFKNEDVIALKPSLSASKWNNMKGEMYIDTLNLYKDSSSLRLLSSEQDSIKEIYTWYAYDLSEVEGLTLTVSGKYKIAKAQKAELHFLIRQYNHTGNVDSITIETTESLGWNDFIIEATIDEESDWAVLYIIGKGDINILLNDCQAWIDDTPVSDIVNRKFAAEKDTEFDDGSGVELSELTPQMVENLVILGKIWGYLKYYHPKVTQGKYNWDYELFRVLPKIVKAKDKEKRNKLISKWIRKYGKIEESSDYIIEDSTKYSRFIDLSWLNNKEMFDDELINLFQDIKNAERSKKFNYYVPSLASQSISPFFKRERSYKSVTWNDQGFRILTLFRMWNLIEYCFPYTHHTESAWEMLLEDLLLKFVAPKDQASYELAIMELGANINDSHGYINIPDNELHKTVLASIYNSNKVPVELIQSVEGHIVVKSTRSEFFNRGDIILSINGENVDTIIIKMEPYIIASNRNGLIRNILPYLLSSQFNHLNVEVIRDGNKLKIDVQHFKSSNPSLGVKSWKDYNLDKRDIIHVDNIKSAEENRDIVQSNMNSEGLIIDMREYPHNDNMKFLPPLILSKYPLWISQNDKSYPGNYLVKLGYDKINEPENTPNYKGKIIILVDENTQSAGESITMQHRLTPNSVIVGRQTAGANGNVCKVLMPGGSVFQFTWNGAYYPNWEILQRKGVKIDIPVSPTVNDIKEGRDVWIEKAIEIIENK